MIRRLCKLWPLLLVNLLVVVIILLHASNPIGSVLHWGFIDQLEYLAYDARMMLTMEPEPDERIVIVDIDEASLAEIGRWPWSRDELQQLVDRLFEFYQVKIIGFDIVFAEPDDSSGLHVLERLAAGQLSERQAFRVQVEALRDELNYDQRFADSLRNRPVILGYYFRHDQTSDNNRSGVLPAPVLSVHDFRPGTVHALVANGYGANLALFQKAAAGAGHFNPEVDADGVVRRVPMLFEFEDAYYESLSLALARHVLGGASIKPGYAETGSLGDAGYSGLEWLQVGSSRVPVDERLRALVPYRGRYGSFPYVSAAAVLAGKIDKVILHDRIVLVGTSAPGLFDLRSTPVQSEYPGVEIHANLIAGILDNTIMEKPAYSVGVEVLHILLAGVLMLLLSLLSPLLAAGGFVALLFTSLAINLWVWTAADLVLPIASVLVLITLMFVINMTYGFFFEQRNKRQLSGLFGQYIPPELVEEMSENPQSYSLEAENREMSVLFSDVRGFTTISESMAPVNLSRLMNELLTPMTHVIHQHRGTIDKYMGDAIMAFWGAPLPDREHARHAIESALQLVARINELQGEFQRQGWPEIRVGVGINSGDMSVGNMGSQFRRAYTVLGDAVNLGSRLEGLTKNYGVDILVSEFTCKTVADHAFREIDRVRVKGRDEPLTIYEPLGLKNNLASVVSGELQLYREALRLYRNRNWDLAEIQFLNLQQRTPLKLYAVYIERIQYYRAKPPDEGWDGVFTHTTK